MALTLAPPKAAKPAPAPGVAELEPKGVQLWMRTALFGTPKEFQSLLDRGLDPASHTDGGTTLLMLAAPDAAKMKMLLDRGVDVNAKAKSGFTALMVASLYRGSLEGIQLLLDKGASAAPGTGVMFNASPLLLAVFAGEPAPLELLHSKRADANRKMLLLGALPASPMVQVVAIGEPEVICALAAAGANIKEHDCRGRPFERCRQVWLYAAALCVHGRFRRRSHGESAVEGVRRPDAAHQGRETALSQAKRYHYGHIEAALEKAGARE